MMCKTREMRPFDLKHVWSRWICSILYHTFYIPEVTQGEPRTNNHMQDSEERGVDRT